MTRNVCEGFTPATGVATGGTACPAANRRTQPWKCSPASTGGATICEAADWTMEADNGSGNSTMGDNTNTSITMQLTNGSYLYVGFEKADQSTPRGIQVWCTNAVNPAVAGDFSKVSTTGLVDSANNTAIFDVKSFNFSGTNYLYMTVGKTGGVVKVYRQQNN